MNGGQTNAFKKLDIDESNPAITIRVSARYEHLDVHRVVKGEDEALYITPKSSDKTIEGSAIVSCHKEAYSTTSTFACKGLQPINASLV